MGPRAKDTSEIILFSSGQIKTCSTGIEGVLLQEMNEFPFLPKQGAPSALDPTMLQLQLLHA